MKQPTSLQWFLTILSLTLFGCASIFRNPASSTTNNEIVVVAAKSADPAACEAFQKNLPGGIKQGYIGESDNNVQIFYYGKWKTNPLVIANGGPGASSWSSFKAFRDALERAGVEYLFFDQKGTGCSSGYPPLNEQNFAAWQNYDSRGLAADIDLLRTNLYLGEKITVFGHSFGSKIALRYAMDFPHSTRAVVFYGDSFVTPENLIIEDMVGTLQKQQAFLDRRLANPKLEMTLRSLEKKFINSPCAADEHNLISACGFDLIRDLSHYYTESTAEIIESLLFKLDNPTESQDAFREIVLKYSHWKIDPTTVLLGFMDYRNIIDGQMMCNIALSKVNIPSWHLNSCAMAKHQLKFLNYISKFVHQDLLTPEELLWTLRQFPTIRFYAVESAGDLDSSSPIQMHFPKNWIPRDLGNVDHFNFINSEEFWKTVKSAF